MINEYELIISSGPDPGKGRHEAVHLAQGVRPHLRVEQHLPPDPPHRPAAAGVQAQVDGGVGTPGIGLPPCSHVLGEGILAGAETQVISRLLEE